MKTEEINDDTKVKKEEINGRKRVAGTNDMTQEGYGIDWWKEVKSSEMNIRS